MNTVWNGFRLRSSSISSTPQLRRRTLDERYQLRIQVSPILGALIAAGIAALPLIFGASAASAWAALTLLMGFIYFALIPVSQKWLSALLLGVGNISVALMFQENLKVLHFWMSAQTIMAGIWLLRTERVVELSAAGLLLGINAGAAFFMMSGA